MVWKVFWAVGMGPWVASFRTGALGCGALLLLRGVGFCGAWGVA